MPDRVVIVGASLAGLRAAEALRQHGHVGSITFVGEETHPPYDRPPLSKQLLTGKVGAPSTALHVADDLDAEWILGVPATGLDLEAKRISLGSGGTLPFDRLVIATGAHPRLLRTAPPGPGVHYLRTLNDAAALRDDLSRSERTVVIGGGFIGLEVASSAHQMGVRVTVIEALPVPLERAIGAEMGQAVADWHARKGIDLRVGVGVERIVGRDRPEAVWLTDGAEVPTDTVVVGVGITPTTNWLAGSGVDLDDGVLCDDRLRVLVDGSPRPDVVAAGDVARWAHPGYGEMVRVEHWTNASEQGGVAARTLLLGEGAPGYAPIPYFWSDQHGAKLQFVGRAHPDDDVAIVEGSLEDDRFVAAYGRDGRLVAALGMRRPARVMAMQQMIATGEAFPLPA